MSLACGGPRSYGPPQGNYQALDGARRRHLGRAFRSPTPLPRTVIRCQLRALKGGADTDKIIDMVAQIRSQVSCPLVFMTYGNIVYHYGVERFAKRAAQAGIDGIILPDTPYEEKDEFAGVMTDNDIAYISLIAPTSNDRIGSPRSAGLCLLRKLAGRHRHPLGDHHGHWRYGRCGARKHQRARCRWLWH